MAGPESPPKVFARRRAAFVAAFAVACGACAPRPRMCTAQADCAATGAKDLACVSGRCQPDRANVRPAIDSAHRIVVRPVDLAYVRRGDAPSGGALPPVFTLGRDSGKLLLRFSVVVPPPMTVVEAYVVLRRSDAVDDDPEPIVLHATRIIQTWQGRSTSWAFQPRTQEMRTPSTTVEPTGSSLVRLDVRDLVRHWPRRDPEDQGIAIVAENESHTGMTFALTATDATDATSTDRGPSSEAALVYPVGRFQVIRSTSAPDVEPYLELYVR